jgi:cytochrome c biogenesis protein CcdA
MSRVSGVNKSGRGAGRVQVRTIVGYGGPAILVAVLIGVMIPFQTNAEIAMSGFAQSLPIGFAAAAGMVATVNPCGFFILPGYVAYQLGTHETGYSDVAVGVRLLRALSVGVMATLGFVLIFSLVGLGIAGGGTFLGGLFPYFGLFVGVVMVIFGGYLLITGRYVGILAVSRVQINHRRGLRNAFIFGVGYGVGSLSCTLPIFLVVVGGSLATGSFVASMGQFLAFGVGMGTVVISITVGAVLFRDVVFRLLRTVMPYVYRTGALFLVGAGAYVVYYWVFFSGLNM